VALASHAYQAATIWFVGTVGSRSAMAVGWQAAVAVAVAMRGVCSYYLDWSMVCQVSYLVSKAEV
jgi:hypothetical protein